MTFLANEVIRLGVSVESLSSMDASNINYAIEE